MNYSPFLSENVLKRNKRDTIIMFIFDIQSTSFIEFRFRLK